MIPCDFLTALIFGTFSIVLKTFFNLGFPIFLKTFLKCSSTCTTSILLPFDLILKDFALYNVPYVP